MTRTSRRTMRKMKTSKKGFDLIKEFEGCRLQAYKDAVDITTIGWGITSADEDIIGTNIHMGLQISQATADAWLEKVIRQKYEPKVAKYDDIYHWNQNQFDALVSFAYNIGSIDGLTDHGKRDIDTIIRKILAYNKAGGKVLAGLSRRRKAEHDLFCTPCKEAYKGSFPALPPRGWYKVGDGITRYLDYQPQIKRVQKFLNWALDEHLTVDGKYGRATEKAVDKFQRKVRVTENGKFGNLCLARARAYMK